MPHHEQVTDYRRCYDIPASKGELFVTLKLNPLPAYDCISAMDVSFNVSDVDSCSHYKLYKVSDTVIFGNANTIVDCIQTAEELGEIHSFCQYRCEPAVNLVFGWSGSSRLQHGMTICDLRWNYQTCWRKMGTFNSNPGSNVVCVLYEIWHHIISLAIYALCLVENTTGYATVCRRQLG